MLFAPYVIAELESGPAEWQSRQGWFNLVYRSSLQPIEVNRMHYWDLRITTHRGEPVKNAVIRVEGGMPAHNHGFPTAPQLRALEGDGEYRLEGLRFHMHGNWEITLHIRSDQHNDIVTITLRL